MKEWKIEMKIFSTKRYKPATDGIKLQLPDLLGICHERSIKFTRIGGKLNSSATQANFTQEASLQHVMDFITGKLMALNSKCFYQVMIQTDLFLGMSSYSFHYACETSNSLNKLEEMAMTNWCIKKLPPNCKSFL
ncbi:hypothetical protein V6Z12_A11G324500 [Gossypium hirsutum]